MNHEVITVEVGEVNCPTRLRCTLRHNITSVLQDYSMHISDYLSEISNFGQINTLMKFYHYGAKLFRCNTLRDVFTYSALELF
jgi:hypothetical protein